MDSTLQRLRAVCAATARLLFPITFVTSMNRIIGNVCVHHCTNDRDEVMMRMMMLMMVLNADGGGGGVKGWKSAGQL